MFVLQISPKQEILGKKIVKINQYKNMRRKCNVILGKHDKMPFLTGLKDIIHNTKNESKISTKLRTTQVKNILNLCSEENRTFSVHSRAVYTPINNMHEVGNQI